MIPLSIGTAGLDEEDMWSSFPQWIYASASPRDRIEFDVAPS